jgi:hypothetical protein
MKFNHRTFILLFLIFISNSCYKSNIIKQKGYIAFNYLDYFHFVPVKKLDLMNSLASFYTENLDTGIMFLSKSTLNYYDSVFKYIDTFNIENVSKNRSREIKTLKIVPVYIEYECASKNKNFDNIDTFNYTIRGRSVQLTTQFVYYKIIRIRPLKVSVRNMKGSYYESLRTCP